MCTNPVHINNTLHACFLNFVHVNDKLRMLFITIQNEDQLLIILSMLNPFQILKSSQLCWKTCKKMFWQKGCVLNKITLHCTKRHMSQILILSAYWDLNRKANKVSKCRVSNHFCLEIQCLFRVRGNVSCNRYIFHWRRFSKWKRFNDVAKFLKRWESFVDNLACIINNIKICSELHLL